MARAKREPRTEVVSVRLTKQERARIEAIGGPTTALRRLLEPQPPNEPIRWPITTAAGRASMVWADGTVGGTWPAVATG